MSWLMGFASLNNKNLINRSKAFVSLFAHQSQQKGFQLAN